MAALAVFGRSVAEAPSSMFTDLPGIHGFATSLDSGVVVTLSRKDSLNAL